MAVRGDEEMNVRRPLAVTTEHVEHLLGRPVGRAAIAGRHDAARPVIAVLVGDDPPAQVVFGLALVEVGIVALGVGVPEIDHRTGQRLAGRIENTALQEHHSGDIVFATVIHARDALSDWRAGDVQRTFDGARGAADQSFLFVLGVLQQVEVMLQSESGDQQAGFVATAETVDVVHRLPELVLGDFRSSMILVSVRTRLITVFRRLLPASLLKPLASLKNCCTSLVWEIFTVMAQASFCNCRCTGSAIGADPSSDGISGRRHESRMVAAQRVDLDLHVGNSGSCIRVSCSSCTLATSNTL